MKSIAHFLSPAVLLLVLCLGGLACSGMETLQRAERLELEMRIDRIVHLERIGEAYFLVGLEYFTMARDAEARGDAEKAREYAAKAKFYSAFHKDLRSVSQRMRDELREPGK